MVAASCAVLSLFAAYLGWLGGAAIGRPALALSFLSAFARTRSANTLEAGLRALVGAAFLVLDDPLGWRGAGLLLGIFLLLTALLMVFLPETHRRLAPLLVGSVRRFMLPFGVASLVLAVALGWALVRSCM